MNQSECLTADWQAVGYEDGARGQPLSFIGKHRKACAKHGVAPDMAKYDAGRHAGLQEFCTPGNGFSQGRSGKPLRGVCPTNLAIDYNRAYQQGRRIYVAAASVRTIQNDIEKQETHLADIEQRIADTEEQLVSDGLQSHTRRELLDELKALTYDYELAERKLVALGQHLNHEQRNFDTLASTANWW
ncbi:MAG: DUF2799 domain-containing protein [Pseudomonadales bacterium]